MQGCAYVLCYHSPLLQTHPCRSASCTPPCAAASTGSCCARPPLPRWCFPPAWIFCGRRSRPPVMTAPASGPIRQRTECPWPTCASCSRQPQRAAAGAPAAAARRRCASRQRPLPRLAAAAAPRTRTRKSGRRGSLGMRRTCQWQQAGRGRPRAKGAAPTARVAQVGALGRVGAGVRPWLHHTYYTAIP